MTELFELSAPRTPHAAPGRQRGGPAPVPAERQPAVRRRRATWDRLDELQRAGDEAVLIDLLAGSGSTRRRTWTTPRSPSRRCARSRSPWPRSATSAAPTATPTAAASAARPRTCRRRPRWPRSTCCSPRRRRGAGQPRLSRRRAAAQPRRAPRGHRAGARPGRRARHRRHLLHHHQRHPADLRRRRLLRASRVRRDGERRRGRRGPRPAAALQGRAGQLRPRSWIGSRRCSHASGGCRSRRGSPSPRATSMLAETLGHLRRARASTASASRRCCARPTGRDELGRDRARAMLEQMVACGREFERRVIAGRALPVREHGQRHARAAPRHPPALSLRRRRRLSRRLRRRRAGRVPPLRRRSGGGDGQRDRRASTASASALARRAARPSPGALPQLLGPLPVRRRLPSRGHRPRPARLRLHPRLAALSLGAYTRLSAARPDYFAGRDDPGRRLRGRRRARRGRVGRALARLGHRVCVVEQRAFPRAHVGESLSPGTWPLLDSLGIARSAVEAVAAPVSRPGSAGVPIDEERVPVGAGLTLDRGRFDALLLDHARASGATVRLGRARRATRTATGWRVPIDAGPRRGPISGRRERSTRTPRRSAELDRPADPGPARPVAAPPTSRWSTDRSLRWRRGGSGGPGCPTTRCGPWCSSTRTGCAPSPPVPSRLFRRLVSGTERGAELLAGLPRASPVAVCDATAIASARW